MNEPAHVSRPNPPTLTNGSGAAAILAASIGSFVLSALALAGDKLPAVKAALIFYKPTGALSGVTTVAILIWLLAWGILEARWRKKTVALGLLSSVAFALFILSFLLTFPPIVDLF
ncbi:MAG TPA: hypothetical protein VN776_02640 [Terracidiphilus sp.]|nr:hypothetical protein [Terracidiphilus sp.]